MSKLDNQRIGIIYALGNQLGIVNRGSHKDGLHILVEGTTGKDSVSSLTPSEAGKVIDELNVRIKGLPAPPPERKKRMRKDSPAGMTGAQQDKVWRLLYMLADYDKTPSTSSLGSRAAGVIKRELGVDATARDPFRWLNYQQGSLIIDALNRYIKNTQRQTGGDRRVGDT